MTRRWKDELTIVSPELRVRRSVLGRTIHVIDVIKQPKKNSPCYGLWIQYFVQCFVNHRNLAFADVSLHEALAARFVFPFSGDINPSDECINARLTTPSVN